MKQELNETLRNYSTTPWNESITPKNSQKEKFFGERMELLGHSMTPSIVLQRNNKQLRLQGTNRNPQQLR